MIHQKTAKEAEPPERNPLLVGRVLKELLERACPVPPSLPRSSEKAKFLRNPHCIDVDNSGLSRVPLVSLLAKEGISPAQAQLLRTGQGQNHLKTPGGTGGQGLGQGEDNSGPGGVVQPPGR